MRDSHCQTLFQFIEWLFKKDTHSGPNSFREWNHFLPGPFLMKYACESVSFNVKGSIKLASCFLNLKDWLQLGCLIQSNFPSSFLPLVVSPLPTDVWPLFYMCVYITMLTICLPIFCCYRLSRLSKIPFTCSSLTKVHDCSAGTQSSHPSQ